MRVSVIKNPSLLMALGMCLLLYGCGKPDKAYYFRITHDGLTAECEFTPYLKSYNIELPMTSTGNVPMRTTSRSATATAGTSWNVANIADLCGKYKKKNRGCGKKSCQ